MNSKLCKTLRGLAQGKTTGQPARGYAIAERKNAQGVVHQFVINHPKTTRGFYRALKQAVRRNGGVLA